MEGNSFLFKKYQQLASECNIGINYIIVQNM